MRRHERLCNRLVQAVYGNDVVAAQQAIERGADADIHVGGEDGHPLIYLAARTADPAMCRLLLSHGVHPDTPVGPASSSNGATALMRAARFGHIRVVRALLDAGAAAGAADDEGNTALLWAASGGHTETLNVLTEAGADTAPIGTDEGITALIAAVWSGSERAVDALLDAGADVNQFDEQGDTAVDHARRCEDPAIEQALVSRGGCSMETPVRPILTPDSIAFAELEAA